MVSFLDVTLFISSNSLLYFIVNIQNQSLNLPFITLIHYTHSFHHSLILFLSTLFLVTKYDFLVATTCDNLYRNGPLRPQFLSVTSHLMETVIYEDSPLAAYLEGMLKEDCFAEGRIAEYLLTCSCRRRWRGRTVDIES